MRALRIVRVALFVASTLYLLFIAVSHHAMRASMIPVRQITDSSFFALGPAEMPAAMRFEEYGVLKQFLTDLPDSLRTGDLATSIQIMEWLGRICSNARIRGIIPESPREARRFLLEENERGSCYNDAILFSTYIQSVGLSARVLALDGEDGMGGSGHNVTEVWSEEHHKWVMFDNQQVALFLLAGTRIPASAFEVRQAALAGREYFDSHLILHQTAGYVIPPEGLWSLYRRGVDFNVLASSDLQTAIEEQKVRQVAEWVELQGRNLGKPALWAGRLIRSAFGSPFIRFRYLDASTPHYGFDGWYVAYRVAVPIWLISSLMVFFSAVRRRSRFGAVEYWMRTGTDPLKRYEPWPPEAHEQQHPRSLKVHPDRIPPPVP